MLEPIGQTPPKRPKASVLPRALVKRITMKPPPPPRELSPSELLAKEEKEKKAERERQREHDRLHMNPAEFKIKEELGAVGYKWLLTMRSVYRGYYVRSLFLLHDLVSEVWEDYKVLMTNKYDLIDRTFSYSENWRELVGQREKERTIGPFDPHRGYTLHYQQLAMASFRTGILEQLEIKGSQYRENPDPRLGVGFPPGHICQTDFERLAKECPAKRAPLNRIYDLTHRIDTNLSILAQMSDLFLPEKEQNDVNRSIEAGMLKLLVTVSPAGKWTPATAEEEREFLSAVPDNRLTLEEFELFHTLSTKIEVFEEADGAHYADCKIPSKTSKLLINFAACCREAAKLWKGRLEDQNTDFGILNLCMSQGESELFDFAYGPLWILMNKENLIDVFGIKEIHFQVQDPNCKFEWDERSGCFKPKKPR